MQISNQLFLISHRNYCIKLRCKHSLKTQRNENYMKGIMSERKERCMVQLQSLKFERNQLHAKMICVTLTATGDYNPK